MSRPRDMEPDNAVSSRPVDALNWVLLLIAVTALFSALAVQYSVVLSDHIMATKVARVMALSGLLAGLASLPL